MGSLASFSTDGWEGIDYIQLWLARLGRNGLRFVLWLGWIGVWCVGIRCRLHPGVCVCVICMWCADGYIWRRVMWYLAVLGWACKLQQRDLNKPLIGEGESSLKYESLWERWVDQLVGLLEKVSTDGPFISSHKDRGVQRLERCD